MKLRTGLAAVTLVTALMARPAGAQPKTPPTPAPETAEPAAASAAGADADADHPGEPGAPPEPEAAPEPPAEPTPVPFGNPDFGPRYTIEQVVVRGNRKTAAALIVGEVGIHAGDVLTASDGRVEAARIHLLSLGFFLDVHLAVQKGSHRGSATRGRTRPPGRRLRWPTDGIRPTRRHARRQIGEDHVGVWARRLRSSHVGRGRVLGLGHRDLAATPSLHPRWNCPPQDLILEYYLDFMIITSKCTYCSATLSCPADASIPI